MIEKNDEGYILHLFLKERNISMTVKSFSTHGYNSIGVGCIVTKIENGTNHYLVGQKRGRTVVWCMPGGHVEPGESFIEAGIRESREECGLTEFNDVKLLALFHTTNSLGSVAISILMKMTYTGTKAPSLTEPNKFLQWKWLSEDMLLTLLDDEKIWLSIAKSSLKYYFYQQIEPNVEIHRFK